MRIGEREIGINEPTYFIADIASNHEGSFDRACALINLAAEAGADAVKFQNFKAETIVSDYGFKELNLSSHQSVWRDSVYDTYKKNETPLEWTPELARVSSLAGVDFLTTPYDLDMLADLAPYVGAWKVGSGDITYKALVKAITKYNKPIILSTGASTDDEIAEALGWIWDDGVSEIALMQCNTNYTTDQDNIKFANLKVLVAWWGGGLMGFSDHTSGHTATLGAIALGARVIEKHFTDDNAREGPDHAFSMTPTSWKEMVARARELELALGDGVKKVEENEKETRILQRRAIRVRRDIPKGAALSRDDLICLRPCPGDSISPSRLEAVIGQTLMRDLRQGDYIRAIDVW